MTKTDYLNKRFELLFKPWYTRLALFLMLFSYFYNLPIIKYSLKGNNEFRLYDIIGLLILYIIYANRNLVLFFIRSKSYLKTMNTFVMWCGITLIFTALFSFFKERPLWIVQTVLYYYHLLIFFYSGVLMAIYLREKKRYKLVAHLILIFSIAEAILLFLQHSGVVPFLWNDAYRISYGGFFSGALGPNKISLGMTMLFSFVYAVGLYLQSHLKVNKILIIGCMVSSIAVIGISGSRTTYLALIIFLCYIFVMKTRKFIALSIVFSLAVIVAFFFNLELIETITTTLENRVLNKVSSPEAFNPASLNVDVEELYEDLGAGRGSLVIAYLEYIANNPYVIPFGIGLNNRLLIGFSAHNIYLSLINEVGLVGLYFYLKWLFSFITLKLGRAASSLKLVLNGLIFAMLVTLYFGEHLYIYRPLFTILGYFILITVLLIVPRYYFVNEKRK